MGSKSTSKKVESWAVLLGFGLFILVAMYMMGSFAAGSAERGIKVLPQVLPLL